MEILQLLQNLVQPISLTLGEYSISLNLILIIAIIVIMEIVKKILVKKFTINNDVWKLVVVGMGFVATLIQFSLDNMVSPFNFVLFVSAGIIYAGVATLIYQSGKLGVLKLISGNQNENK